MQKKKHAKLTVALLKHLIADCLENLKILIYRTRTGLKITHTYMNKA